MSVESTQLVAGFPTCWTRNPWCLSETIAVNVSNIILTLVRHINSKCLCAFMSSAGKEITSNFEWRKKTCLLEHAKKRKYFQSYVSHKTAFDFFHKDLKPAFQSRGPHLCPSLFSLFPSISLKDICSDQLGFNTLYWWWCGVFIVHTTMSSLYGLTRHHKFIKNTSRMHCMHF